MSNISEEEQFYNVGKKMRDSADKGGCKGWWIVLLIAIMLFLYFFGSIMNN